MKLINRTKAKMAIFCFFSLLVYNSCEEESPALLPPGDVPEASFSLSVDPADPLTITITNGSTGAFSYIWNFGDASGGFQRDVSHTYEENGTFEIQLIVANRGGKDVDSTSQSITVSLPPVPNFGTEIDDKTVVFTNTSENAVSWSWDFGDGTNSSEENPTHVYTDNGLFEVTLTSTNILGETEEISKNVGIGPLAIADFTANIDQNTVTFQNGSSNGDSYLWDFGDGTTSTEQSPTHVFRLGEAQVKLTTTNALNTDEISQTIMITEANVIGPILSSMEGRVWTLAEIAGSVRVGPTPGSGEWWPGPSLEDVQGARACHQDDEFVFLNDGSYKYASQGATLFDDYIPGGDGSCKDPATFDAPFNGLTDNDNYSFTVTEATDTELAKITVNGTGAFIGFSKASNDGEYSPGIASLAETITYDVASYTLVNGKEQLMISVAYCGPFCYWTMVLEPND